MSNLENMLLLSHVHSFEVSGIVDGCGFLVRVMREGDEGEMVLVRHHENPWTDHLTKDKVPGILPSILAERDRGPPGHCWVPWHPVHGVHSDYVTIKFENDREAVKLALWLCEGLSKPVDLVPLPDGEPWPPRDEKHECAVEGPRWDEERPDDDG